MVGGPKAPLKFRSGTGVSGAFRSSGIKNRSQNPAWCRVSFLRGLFQARERCRSQATLAITTNSPNVIPQKT